MGTSAVAPSSRILHTKTVGSITCKMFFVLFSLFGLNYRPVINIPHTDSAVSDSGAGRSHQRVSPERSATG